MATKMKITSLFTAFGSASAFAFSLLTSASPASASTLGNFAQGTFNISGGTVEIESFGTIGDLDPTDPENENPFTDFDFFNLDGTNSVGTGQFSVGGGTGDFTQFLSMSTPPDIQSGIIRDLGLSDIANIDSVPVNSFLDFTFQNEGNTFDLTGLDDGATFDATGSGVTISIGGTGVFNLVGFDPTPADITFGTEITFNSLDGNTTPPADINSREEFIAFLSNPENLVTGISWSGEASTNPPVHQIPESSNLVALLGLGLLGGTVLVRQRKHKIG